MSPAHRTDFEIAVLPTAEAGEGPRWDAASATLLWVDIPAKVVHRYDPATGTDTTRQVADVVSLALPRRQGGVVVGLPDGLHLLGDRRSRRFVAIEPERTDTRTNDGACDRAGRLWVGTMALDERSPVAALYRVDPDLSVTTVLTGTTISNGLGWSPSGRRFYFIDSPTRRVDVFDLDPATGALEDRRPFRRRRGRGRRPRRPRRRRRGRSLGRLARRLGVLIATRPTASSPPRYDCPWPRSRAAVSVERSYGICT